MDNIIPTEIDTYYRFGKIQGYVHDAGGSYARWGRWSCWIV